MARTIDIPLLHDRHSHVSVYAALAGCPSLAGRGPGEALDLLRGLPGDRITTVLGWQTWNQPLASEAIRDLPPALIVNFSLHGCLCTPAARPMLDRDQLDLLERQLDPQWREGHMDQLLGFFGTSAGFDAGKLEAFMTGLQAVGIGAADDMLLTGPEALKVIQASPWRGRIRCWATPAVYRTLDPRAQAAVAGLKLFTDGAVGARTAAMDGAFRDGAKGLLLFPGETLRQALADLQPLGKALAIHAIGGRAVSQVLDALEGLAAQGLRFPRVQMEHVQFITLPDARRAKALGVVLSMQPNFNSDSVDYVDRLEPRDLEANNPFRMLIDQAGFRCGEDLIFGSDGMPHGVEYALQWSLFPPFPGQRLTVEELVAGYGPAPEGAGRSVLRVDEELRQVKQLQGVSGTFE